MDRAETTLAQAAAGLTIEDLQYLQEHGMIPAPDTHAAVTHATATRPQAASQETRRKRRHMERSWPETGTILEADYQGTHYEAEVIPAPKFKSGKALKILTGDAASKICHSMSGAMLTATESQRKHQGLSRKGLANGWAFWKVTGGANEGKT